MGVELVAVAVSLLCPAAFPWKRISRNFSMERNFKEFLYRKGCQALEGAALPMVESPPLEGPKE